MSRLEPFLPILPLFFKRTSKFGWVHAPSVWMVTTGDLSIGLPMVELGAEAV